MTFQIHVSPLQRIGEVAALNKCRYMLSLMSADHAFARPGIVEKDKHLTLTMNDIAFRGTGDLIAPQEQHVGQIIAFTRRWNGDGPLLIHCWMGVSRSPAAALIAALALRPELDDDALVAALRAASACATPNARLVALGDAALNRRGRLTEAVKRIGRGAECSINSPFVMNF